MSKGPSILRISGFVMIIQAIIGLIIVVFTGLSMLTMLNKRPELREQMFADSGIMTFVILGTVLVTSVALLVCALKSMNTYNYYSIPGGNNKYLVPNKVVLVSGAITFLVCVVAIMIAGFSGMAVVIMLCSGGWVLALLNLIIVKKDREERAKEPPKKAWQV